MARPPLLCEEGNSLLDSSSFIHTFIDARYSLATGGRD